MVRYKKVLNSLQMNDLMSDVARAVVQVFIVHLLSYFFDNEGKLLSEKMLKKTLYIVFSMIFYHLVVKKMIIKDKRTKT